MQHNSTFVQYAKSLAAKQYNTLSESKERELLLAYKVHGDQVAFEALVQGYLRFVIYVLRPYTLPSGVDVMDAIQEGNLGLIVGLKKYNIKKYDCRVSTYCVYWIRFYVGKLLDERSKYRGLFYPLEDHIDVLSSNELSDISKAAVSLDIVNTALRMLGPREKFVIKSYYGLEAPYQAKTLQEIGAMLHINFERVRQLRDFALSKMSKDSLIDIVLP